MRAAVFHQIGEALSIESVPDPRPRKGQVVLEVMRAGVCGSDLHLTITPGALNPGAILGHEFAGTIVDANGTDLSRGARVTAIPIHPCWTCPECEGRHFIHCRTVDVTGIGQPGAFAQYVAVEAGLVKKLPLEMDFREAALIEPLAVGYRTVRRAGSVEGKNVLVIGAGPIGAAVTIFAALAGAKHTLVSDFSPLRRAKALELGATATVDPRQDSLDTRYLELCGSPPDIVFECVGLPGLITQSIDAVRTMGRVVVAGGCFELDQFMPMVALRKELSIFFSCAYEEDDFDSVISHLAAARISPKPLITSSVSLEDLPSAFEALRTPSSQCKVLVEP
jgi:(R,R)-butanediol dehydrogenase / meso-butanediol dehydrogenase / diacetyl reductase